MEVDTLTETCRSLATPGVVHTNVLSSMVASVRAISRPSSLDVKTQKAGAVGPSVLKPTLVIANWVPPADGPSDGVTASSDSFGVTTTCADCETVQSLSLIHI